MLFFRSRTSSEKRIAQNTRNPFENVYFHIRSPLCEKSFLWIFTRSLNIPGDHVIHFDFPLIGIRRGVYEFFDACFVEF